jgi:signal transduction histidine kinase
VVPGTQGPSTVAVRGYDRTVTQVTSPGHGQEPALGQQASRAAAEAWIEDHALRTRWRVATTAVVSAMLSGQHPEELLRTVAQAGSDLVGGHVATIAVPWVPGQSLRLRVAVGYRSHDLEGAIFPIEASLSGLALRTRRGTGVVDAASDRNAYQPICELGDMGPAVIAPLIARGEAFGTVLVARHRGAARFSDRELALLEAFADHAALALEFAAGREGLERLAIVEERERIGRELHDTVIQNLFAVGLDLRVAVAGCPEPAGQQVEEAITRLDDIIAAIRNTVLELSPGHSSEGRDRPATAPR